MNLKNLFIIFNSVFIFMINLSEGKTQALDKLKFFQKKNNLYNCGKIDKFLKFGLKLGNEQEPKVKLKKYDYIYNKT